MGIRYNLVWKEKCEQMRLDALKLKTLYVKMLFEFLIGIFVLHNDFVCDKKLR